MHQLCVRSLNRNLRLFDCETGELVSLQPDEPISAYVRAIGASLDRIESRPGGATTYRGRSVVARTYDWSTER
jgi:hypothetical protein